jgi:hypothetical protein
MKAVSDQAILEKASAFRKALVRWASDSGRIDRSLKLPHDVPWGILYAALVDFTEELGGGQVRDAVEVKPR